MTTPAPTAPWTASTGTGSRTRSSAASTTSWRPGAPRPDLFRPPYGLTDEFVGAFAAGARLRSVYWSTSLEHHLREPSIDRAVERLLDGIRPGDIVLAHDGSGAVGRPEHRRTDRSRTLRALPRLLDGLAARGYRVLDVPRLLDAGEPRRSGELRHG